MLELTMDLQVICFVGPDKPEVEWGIVVID